MTQAPLILERISKSFGGRAVVRDLSFVAPRGGVLGFLGPNGAGKSTTLRIALGILSPDQGDVRLFGAKPNLGGLRRVGFLPEERGLYRRMSARATIAYFGQLKGLTGRDARKRATALLERYGLGDSAAKPISRLSKGMAQKVQILCAVVHKPELIVLDEPFSGLDPVNQQGLEGLIREAHAEGATIVFSTHVMEHAERLCDRLVVIARGEKRFDGGSAEALALLPRRARVAVTGAFDLAPPLAAAGFGAREDAARGGEGRSWIVDLPAGRDAQAALKAAVEAGAPVVSFTPEDVRLREVFVSLVGADGGAETTSPGES